MPTCLYVLVDFKDSLFYASLLKCLVVWIKYEILKYLNKDNAAEELLKELENIVNLYDSPDSKRRFEYLKNEGTTHETFLKFIQEAKRNAENEKKEYEELVEEMKYMDEKEKEISPNSEPQYHINLFPIGYFSFPKKHLKYVLDNLNVTEEAQKNYVGLFEYGVVPICNLYYNPITKIGPQDGYLADKGIENWRRIFEIRKFFFDNGYFRVHYYD